MGENWSPVEDTFLLENASRLSYEELSLYLGKTDKSIRERSFSLGCHSQVSGNQKVYRVCRYAECRRLYKVRYSLYKKQKKVFCSQECEDLYAVLFYPTRQEIERKISSDLSFEEICKSFKLMPGVLYDLYLDYNLPGRDSSIEKILIQDKAKELKRNKLVKQTGGTPMNKFRGGYKPCLGVSVRSGWENNVLLWLNEKKIKWDYEPKSFYFEEVTRGTKGYIPDIWLEGEKVWIEVKGYMSSVDKTKIKRFKKYYPEEFQKLQAITKNDKVDSTKFFKDFGVPIYAYYDDIAEEYAHLPNWIR